MMAHKKILVVGILAVVLVTATITIAWLNQNRFWNQEPISYNFDAAPASLPASVTLDLNLQAGFVWLQFEDNASLLYRVHMTTTRSTIQQDGDPSVMYADNEIDLTYTNADVTIILGSGTNYTLEVDTSAGKIFALIGSGAHIRDLELASNIGDIELRLENTTIFQENVTIAISSYSSHIDVNATLPTSIGGSFAAFVNDVGTIYVWTPTWTQVSDNHYKTPNFGTANITVTITVHINYGTIFAGLE
jgi:hypothetical protein